MSTGGRADELDPEQVREWILATEIEVKQLDRQAAQTQAALAQARQRLILFHELLATLTKSPVRISDTDVAVGRTTRDRTIEAAAEILGEFERPMTIQEIHAAFVRQGRPLPGRGTPTNILAHISTSDVFVRPQRGVYALAAWTKEESETPDRKVASGDQQNDQPQNAVG